MALSLSVFSWCNIPKLPQRVSLAGIGLFFTQAPLAYSKKSSPAFAVGSILAGSIYFLRSRDTFGVFGLSLPFWAKALAERHSKPISIKFFVLNIIVSYLKTKVSKKDEKRASRRT